jgi:geranylgeranyl pyrophosphate synthase
MQKGCLSDLDEGKYSFIIIHALNNANNGRLKSLLQLRSRQGHLLAEQKTLIMKMLTRSRSLEYTLSVLNELQAVIERMLEKIESGITEEKNWMIRAIMARLRVSDPLIRHHGV